MSRKVVLIVALLLSLSINIPTNAVAMPTNPQIILPEDCRILVGTELTLTLDGTIPPDATITWDVTDGGITSVLPGLDALFIAPSRPTMVTISVSISPVLSGMETRITRQCMITSPNHAPKGMA